MSEKTVVALRYNEEQIKEIDASKGSQSRTQFIRGAVDEKILKLKSIK